jgi:phospholipid/cholesterol/gamma-HCH transport system substrate-binding protein
MARQFSYFQIGLFFLIAVAIAIGGLIWVGAVYVFQPAKTYETFFQESVEGLGPGADVSYLGVRIGRVIAISIAPDGKLIRVEMNLSPNFDSRGKAAQLRMRGITGQLYVALDQAPANLAKVTPKITFVHPYPLIPAQPGEMRQIETALEKIYKKLNAADLAGLAEDWKETARTANDLLANADLRKAIRNFRDVSADIKNLLAILGERGTPAKWQASFRNLAKTAEAARRSSEALAVRLEKLPPGAAAEVAKEMEQTMFQINRVLTDLQGLVHELREEPGKVLVVPKGKEPFRK